MIHFKATRKRSFSKKSSFSKKHVTIAEGHSANDPRDTAKKRQKDFLEFVVGYNKETCQRGTELSGRTSTKSTSVPSRDETSGGEHLFVTELVRNPRENSPVIQKKTCIKTHRKNFGKLQADDLVSAAERPEKSANRSYQMVDENSTATFAHSERSFSGKIAECDETKKVQQMSQHGYREATDGTTEGETTTTVKHAVAFDESESSSEAAPSTGDVDNYTTKTYQHKTRRYRKVQTVETTNLKKDFILKRSDCAPPGLENEVPNDITYHTCSDSDGTKFCVKYPAVKIYRSEHSEHDLVTHFDYHASAVDGGGTSTNLSSNTELDNQSQEDDADEAPPLSLVSASCCPDTGRQNSDFKSAQYAELFPASSDYNIAQKEVKSDWSGRAFLFRRHASHSDISDLTFSRDGQLGRPVDMYYEVLSSPAASGVERSSEDMTDSRRQSLEDVVPELPTVFSGSADRFAKPSSPLGVPNLFWWRRPSDITELRSTGKHPCDEGDVVCQMISGESTQRRYSENMFGKPKKFLTLRFNQLREMWNKPDKGLRQAAKQKAKQNRKASVDSTSSTEQCENKDAKDPELQLRIEEKNELIINSLREVVRKCTFMDPMQRPRSGEVYKKLKKLMLD